VPTKTLKCCGCKERFDRETMLNLPAGNFCTIDCAMAYSRAKSHKDKVKKSNKDHAQRKRTFYEGDIKTRKAAAKLACHKYIRERDRGKPCICCGRPLGPKFDAGHYYESGNNPRIRYDEDNIHGQNVYCNQYQGGNSDDYEGRLRIKIGDARVDRLKSMKGGVMKRSAQDYKEIEDYYNNKLKEL
jgi:hypothetical protein